jgi:hypothetical protein
MAPKTDKVVSLRDLNQSELVLLANWNGLNASRALPRETLIDMLTNLTPNSEPGPFDKERHDLSEYMKAYWYKLRMQAYKKVCPDCYKCRDLQVLEHYLANRINIGGS